MDKISVIIPIFNVEKYLNKCVDSVINQTYKKIEIILVDDGSPDNCPAICDEYAKNDDRVRVIHKRNGGLSDARNAGIDVCEGDYITFIDSDDYVESDLVELLYKNLVNNNCDISTCSYNIVYENEPVFETAIEDDAYVYSAKDALGDLFYQKHTTTSACAKLYKKQLFDNIRYPKGKMNEDLGTTYRIFSKSNKIVVSSKKKYCYLQRHGSLIHSKFALDRMDGLAFAEDALRHVEKYYPQIIKPAQNRVFIEAIYILIALIPQRQEYTREYARCVSVVKKFNKVVAFDAKSKKQVRLFAAISLVSVPLLLAVFSLKRFCRTLASS